MTDDMYQNALEAGTPNCFVDPDYSGINSHYVVNAPYAYVSSWGQLEDVYFGWGRETTSSSINDLNATVSFYGFNCNPAAPDFIAPAEFTTTTTKYGGYYTTQEFFEVTRPKVLDEETEKMVDDDFANYINTYDVGYTLSFGDTFGDTPPAIYTISKKVVMYNDYGLASLASKAVAADRQAANYSSSAKFTTYLNALTAAEAIVLPPKQYASFDPSVYEPAATALENAIEALDETAQGAGVDALIAAREAVEPENAEDAEYDDAGFNYFGVEDYKRYTYERYRDARKALDRLIDSQTVNEEDYETTEEYLEALENIPTLSAFQVTYAKHMYEMTASRLLRADTGKYYLQHSKNLITSLIKSQSYYASDKYAEYTRALNFANAVLADNSADLRQTKVNEARYQLVQAYKNLTERKDADYTQLDQALADAAAYLDLQDNYTEDSYNNFLEAYQAAADVARGLEGTDANQADIDEKAQALLDAIDALTEVGGGDDDTLGIKDEAKDVLGVEWDVTLKELTYGDGYYVDGLAYYNTATPADILKGNIADEHIQTDGMLTTGDYVEMSDGTIVYFVLYGELTGDGNIDIDDYSACIDIGNWDHEYSGFPGDTPYSTAADVNADSNIDIDDVSLVALLMNWDVSWFDLYQDYSGYIVEY